MRTELANSLSGLADDYLKHEQARVETLYQEILRQNFARLLQDLIGNIRWWCSAGRTINDNKQDRTNHRLI